MSEREWKPIETAPHYRPVRIKCDDGTTKPPMKFTPPYWWDAPNGQYRIADDVLYAGSAYIRATHWAEP